MKNLIITLLILIAIVVVISFVTRNNAPAPDNVNEPIATALTATTSQVAYFNNVKGYYAEPIEEGDYPGVVLIHEWWGLNDNIKGAAEKLAREGYQVLAVDLYNGKVATTTADAQKYVASVKQPESTNNLKAAVNFLANKGADKIASFGWCFGGGKSLELAMSGEKLDATVIYYGQLTDDRNKLKNISWPILGIFGDKDTSISTSSVSAFSKALDELNINNEIYMYPGVGHAFANPSNRDYAPTQTADAWAKTLAFLDKHLKQ
jgi:carboxymethylenebutenolidase